MLSTNKKLLAVSDGTALPLSSVPDEAFSSGMLGDGFAIDPVAGNIYSPASGHIDSVTDTRHAYTIHSDDGLDILVHVGIDTVKLGGEGFISLVEPGDAVRAGDIIARVDLEHIKNRGLSAITPVLVANHDTLKHYDFKLGQVRGGKSAVMTYKK